MAKLTGIIAQKKEQSESYFRENLLPSETNNVSKGFRNHIKGGLYDLLGAGSLLSAWLIVKSVAGATVLGGIGALLLGGIAVFAGVRATAHNAAGSVQIIKGIVDKISGENTNANVKKPSTATQNHEMKEIPEQTQSMQ